MGIRPTQFSTLDMLRIESYLLFYPGDNSETFPFEDGTPAGDSLWELGLEFVVSPGKEGFIGAENHYAMEGKERFKIYGVKLSDSMEQMEMFARVHADGKDVGVITYGLSSELNNYSVAIARLDPSVAKPGTKLTVVQPNGTELAATAEEMPFYDKDKAIRTAKG